jgi:hypothetical protein
MNTLSYIIHEFNTLDYIIVTIIVISIIKSIISKCIIQ